MTYLYPGGLVVVSQEVVRLTEDHIFLTPSAYEKIDESWTPVSQLGSATWDDAKGGFDLSLLPADIAALDYFWRAKLQADFENLANNAEHGAACGVGADGSDPSQLSIAVEGVALMSRSNRFPFTTFSADSPWTPKGATLVEAYGAASDLANVILRGTTATWFSLEVGIVG